MQKVQTKLGLLSALATLVNQAGGQEGARLESAIADVRSDPLNGQPVLIVTIGTDHYRLRVEQVSSSS